MRSVCLFVWYAYSQSAVTPLSDRSVCGPSIDRGSCPSPIRSAIRYEHSSIRRSRPRDKPWTPERYISGPWINDCVYTSSKHSELPVSLLHTGWAKKSKPDNFCNIFVYCQPIFIIFGAHTLEETGNRGIYS